MQFLKTSIFFLTVALFVACAQVPSDFEGIDGPVVLSLDIRAGQLLKHIPGAIRPGIWRENHASKGK
jgi:hypothetical protein